MKRRGIHLAGARFSSWYVRALQFAIVRSLLARAAWGGLLQNVIIVAMRQVRALSAQTRTLTPELQACLIVHRPQVAFSLAQASWGLLP